MTADSGERILFRMGEGPPLPVPIALGGPPLSPWRKQFFLGGHSWPSQVFFPAGFRYQFLDLREICCRTVVSRALGALSGPRSRLHSQNLCKKGALFDIVEASVVRFWFCAKFHAEPWCRELWAPSVGQDLAFTPSKRASPATSQRHPATSWPSGHFPTTSQPCTPSFILLLRFS